MDHCRISYKHIHKPNDHNNAWLCGVFSKMLTGLSHCGRKRNERDRHVRTLNKKIECLENRLESLSKTVEDITQTDTTRVGFSACVPYPLEVTSGSILNCFTLVKCNVGGCFNPNRGVFMAPLSGLYFTSITLDIAGRGDKVDVMVVRERGGTRDVVIKINAASLGSCACSTAVVELLRGDTLFAECIGGCTVAKTLSCYSNFTCSKIS